MLPVQAVADGQHHVPGLLLRIDVPGRGDDVLERIAAVDDRPVLASFDELLEEQDVPVSCTGGMVKTTFLSANRGPGRQNDVLQVVGGQEAAARLERPFAGAERGLADRAQQSAGEVIRGADLRRCWPSMPGSERR